MLIGHFAVKLKSARIRTAGLPVFLSDRRPRNQSMLSMPLMPFAHKAGGLENPIRHLRGKPDMIHLFDITIFLV